MGGSIETLQFPNYKSTGFVCWGIPPQQQPGSYRGGEMMMMKISVSLGEETGAPSENTSNSSYISIMIHRRVSRDIAI